MPERPAPVASYAHTLAMVALLMLPVGWALSRPLAPVGTGPAGPRSSNLPFYAVSVGGNLALAYFAFVGVHWRGHGISALVGQRWANRRQLLADVGVTAGFLLVWEVVARAGATLLSRGDTSGAPDTAALLPSGVAEVAAWIVVSVVAGVCEEMVFRGYLQRQFSAATRSVALGVAAQGVLFGVGHVYKGWRQAVLIAGLGVLYGALAAWRRNLGPNMAAHALSDIYEGWLRGLLPFG